MQPIITDAVTLIYTNLLLTITSICKINFDLIALYIPLYRLTLMLPLLQICQQIKLLLLNVTTVHRCCFSFNCLLIREVFIKIFQTMSL